MCRLTPVWSVLGCLLAAACMAAGARAQLSRPAPPDTAISLPGTAVPWPDLPGRVRTASGDRYRPSDWVAADPTLPLGTRLLLSDERGRRAVVVTVVERASLLETGSMLVSRAAADLLGIRDGDPTPILYRRLPRNTPLEPGPWAPERSRPGFDRGRDAHWSVQLGSFSDRRTAERYADLLDGARVERVNVGRRSVYRVYFGRFRERADAEAWRERLAGWGITGFVKSLDEQ